MFSTISLTKKMTILTIITGLIVWGSLDFIGNRTFKKLFEHHIREMLSEQAQEDRLLFDSYINDFYQLAKLFASSEQLHTYLREKKWYRQETSGLLTRNHYPSWFPSRSLMRSLAHPRFAILFDSNGMARELYHRRHDQAPEALLHPSRLLLENSSGQTNMTTISGQPFVVTLKEVAGPHKAQVLLLLASPIDDETFLFIQGDFPKNLVGIVATESNTILSSSNPSLLPTGTTLAEIEHDYLFTKRKFQDYGRVGILINFFSFVPRGQVDRLVHTFLDKERQYRTITAISLIFAFTLLMLAYTARIMRLVKFVQDFSQQEEYGLNPAKNSGDQIDLLDMTFKHLVREIAVRTQELRRTNEELSSTIDSLRETRDELVQAEKLAVVGQMAGVIAHEVLNPISAVAIRVEKDLLNTKKTLLVLEKQANILSEIDRTISQEDSQFTGKLLEGNFIKLKTINQAFSESQQVRHSDVKFIQRLITKITKIIDGFRQMSKTKKYIETVSLTDIINEIIEDLHDRFEKNRIELNLQLSYNGTIQADYMELHLVISNLLRNAIQAIEMGKQWDKNKIDITLAPTDGKCLEILISDTGVGINSSNFEKIFEPNFTSKGREGTGIGLSVSRKIVRGYNGKLSVLRSKEGCGTTFQILLYSLSG